MQAHPEPLFLADDGTYVDVTDFVRFELDHRDIRYGVLDLIVTFVYRGRRERCYLLHFFPVDAVKENVHTPFPEWTEGFEFPPALLKLRAVIDDAIIPLYHQGCIAINTRGATIYGTKRTRLRRMILHIQHHESHLLAVLAEAVSARPIAENVDPFDIFLQTPLFSLPSSASRLLVHYRQTTTACPSSRHATNCATAPTASHRPYASPDRISPACKSAKSACIGTGN